MGTHGDEKSDEKGDGKSDELIAQWEPNKDKIQSEKDATTQ